MRQKHVPERTCVGCGTSRPKREMVRVVRTPTGSVQVDPTGKLSGRGAYLCKSASCWQRALQKSLLNRTLKVEITPGDRDGLLKYGRLLVGEGATESAPEAEGEAGS